METITSQISIRMWSQTVATHQTRSRQASPFPQIVLQFYPNVRWDTRQGCFDQRRFKANICRVVCPSLGLLLQKEVECRYPRLLRGQRSREDPAGILTRNFAFGKNASDQPRERTTHLRRRDRIQLCVVENPIALTVGEWECVVCLAIASETNKRATRLSN